MKTYKYSQEQVDRLYAYLMSRPMAEAEGLVAVLRTPLNLDEITGAAAVAKEEQSEQESAKKDGSKGKKG